PESIEGVLVTHEHIDHVSGVRRAAKKWGWRVLATAGTITEFPALHGVGAEVIPRCGPVRVGDIDMQTTPTSHDAAESVCVVLTSVPSGARVGIATDLGHVTGAVRRAMKDVDLLVLESNHDMEMLRTGPYPV